jgi:hypothetical protein
MSNPVAEYLEKYGAGPLPGPSYSDIARAVAEGVQRAGAGKRPKTISEGLQSAGVRAGALAGAFGLYEAAGRAYQAITKQHDFNAMLEANPELKGEQKRDPKMFNRFYNSLRQMNPQFAAEPVVAGTYMRKMMTSPEAAGGILVESLQATKGVGPGFEVTMGEEPSFKAKL